MTARISKRENEVLHLIAYEYSSKQIAETLYIASETVNSHRKNLLKKFQAINTAGLVRRAMEKGMIAPMYQ